MTEPNPTAADETANDNLSFEQFSASMLGGQESPEPTEEPAEEPTEPEEEPEEEETPESESAEETTEDEESTDEEPTGAVDFASLSDEEFSALLNDPRAKSGMLKRINKLTARAKAAEEQVSKLASTNPTPKVDPIANNPFSDLDTMDAVKAKREELEGVLESTEALLDDHEDLGNEDTINYQGAEFTKSQIRAAQRNARKALNKLLPAQEAAIREADEVRGIAEHVESLVEQQFTEQMADDDFASRHSAILEDPEVKKAMAASPKFAAQMPWLAAHYLNSMRMTEQSAQKGEKPKAKPTGQPLKVKPPAAPGGAAAPTGKKQDNREQARKAAWSKLETTGSADDLARALSY